MKTREELEENQMKRYNWEQDQIAHMKVKWHNVIALFELHFLYFHLSFIALLPQKYSPEVCHCKNNVKLAPFISCRTILPVLVTALQS